MPPHTRTTRSSTEGPAWSQSSPGQATGQRSSTEQEELQDHQTENSNIVVVETEVEREERPDGESDSTTERGVGGQTGASSRSDEAAEGNQAPCGGEATDILSVEELVEEAVINVNGPCENLPMLRPQELKIIGRCVTFVGETAVGSDRLLFHYEGLVGMITKDTVTLLNVRRFTDEDFLKHQETLGALHEGGHRNKGNQQNNTDAVQQESARVQQDITGGDSEESDEVIDTYASEDDTISIDDYLREPQPTRENSENPADDTYAARHRRLMTAGTMGPVPFMTFMRRRIHNVVFARDPPATFYSLFQDPAKRHFDMQCLCMFVRRYLVHTSQGNNPRNIYLRPFVAWRCNCKDIDNELLIKVAKQELAYLLKTEREIVKAFERTTRNRRNALTTYQPPSGLFGATGILFLTRIPAQTFCLAVLEMLVTVLMLGFSAYSFAAAPPVVIYTYVKDYTFSVTLAGIMSLLASSTSVFHSIRMRLPLVFTIFSVLRLGLVTVGIGLNMMVLIMIGRAVSFSQIRDYLNELAGKSNELCHYYSIHNCTGYGEVCEVESTVPLCMWNWCPVYHGNTCTQALSANFTRIFIPIVVFSMVLVAMFVIDHFMHYRLIQVSRLLMAQM
ncbi:hypothetical protein DQ04_05011010 [Trypanosoma grayi]|uniref:hypothetical protein n=1 Tax=Trypanosoma grayi TaxID=71804 RepID=UPI0004F45849|nr:hypothetical protein DQ04_05011010 [Trypanosoma grayi]KEG09570.1 hypothetical protein DQ04_05011010 [Trypanosoma grayi]